MCQLQPDVNRSKPAPSHRLTGPTLGTRVPDANILVAARFLTAPDHRAARAALERLGDRETLRLSRQVLREYLAVVTRPQAWTRPLGMPDALDDVRRLSAALEVLEDGSRVTDLLADLCRSVPVGGKQVHDANIVATMLAHGERQLLTLNTGDFRRYGGRIELVTV